MEKLPEFLALSIGMGILSLAGVIAWQSAQNEQNMPLNSPVVEIAPATTPDTRPMQARVVASGR